MRTYKKGKWLILLLAFLILSPTNNSMVQFKNLKNPKSSQIILNIVVTSEDKYPILDIIPDFLASGYGAGISDVNVITSGNTANDQLNYIQSHLAIGDTSIDVMSMDAVWTASFVNNGWVANLDSYLGSNEMDNYIGGFVDSCEYQGSYWAIPYYINLGVLYYRKDLLTMYGYDESDIDTWAELNATANDILAQENNPDLVGYVGQFDNYEGGTVNFQEWIGSNGVTNIFDSEGNPVVNQTDAINALAFLKALIAPSDITDLRTTDYIISREALLYNEGTSGNKWLEGESIFCRQWPYIYWLTTTSPLLNATDMSGNYTQFGVAPMPTFTGAPDEKSSVAAGIILGVSNYSEHKEAAFNLAKWLSLNESQYYALKQYGHFPALKETYSTLPPGYEYLEDFYLASDVTLARPKYPDYPEISDIISDRFSEIISCQKSAIEGLNDLQQDLLDLTSLPKINVEILKKLYTSTNFNLTFYVSNNTLDPIKDATIQIWWNGTNVSSDIKNHGNGNYSISLTPIILTLEEDPILLNMIVSATGYEDKSFETYIAVHPCDLMGDILEIEIIQQTFSTKEFNITLLVHNLTGHPIDLATIRMWWDGVNVSSNVQNIGNGYYFVSLESITVASGEDAILLNMTISAVGYEDKYFETYIAVDPASLLKGKGAPTEQFPLTLTIIILTSSIGAIIALIGIYWLRKRRTK